MEPLTAFPNTRGARALTWLGRQLSNLDNPASYFDPLAQVINPMWLQGVTPARVEQRLRETPDTVTFVLRPAPRWPGFEAGQHVCVQLDIDGIRHTRTFSLSSSPLRWRSDGRVTLTIKRVARGRATQWMHDHLHPGDTLALGNAFGDFLLPAPAQPVLYIAGGSGITPILSHLETMAAQDYRAPVTLLYFVRSPQDVIAGERLRALAARYRALTLHLNCSQEQTPPRHLSDADLDAVPGLKARQVYLCGPGGLMDLAGTLLRQRGLREAQMHRAFFAPPAPAEPDASQPEGDVTFTRSGAQIRAADDATLLELAEAAGLSPRHGCRMGICHQCSCRKTGGTVRNRLTGQTSGPGEETVQLCISQPCGPVSLDL